MGLRMKQMANGLDFGEVLERDRIKSISKLETFEEDTRDPVKITETLEMLVESVQSNAGKW
jgi:DNA polymerase IV (archaeal DinB-like DNA polymerase)